MIMDYILVLLTTSYTGICSVRIKVRSTVMFLYNPHAFWKTHMLVIILDKYKDFSLKYSNTVEEKVNLPGLGESLI